MERINLMDTGACAVVDRFGELEQRINDHINQEAAQEAAQDEAGRLLRAEINRHSEERCKAMEEVETHRQRSHKRAMAKLMREVRQDSQRDTFIRRNIGNVAITAGLGILYVTGGISLWLGLTVLAINAGLFACNIVAYATRNNKKGE